MTARFLFLLLLWTPVASTAQTIAPSSLYDYPHSLAFALHLAQKEQYASAAREYERVVFLHPSDSNAAGLLRCYRKGNLLGEGIFRAEQLRADSNAAFGTHAGIEYGKLLLISGATLKATSFLAAAPPLPPQDSAQFAVAIALLARHWQEADSLCTRFSARSKALDNACEPFAAVTAHAATIRYKSPVVATALSIAVPGLGKGYADQWRDGVISLVFVAGNALLAQRGFKRSGMDSVQGWAFGGISAGFYLANIYGSYRAATRYNNRIDNAILRETRLALERAHIR